MSIPRTYGLSALVGGLALLGATACDSAPKASFPSPAVDASLSAKPGEQTAVLSGGCFWGMEGVFQHVKGVTKVVSGYSGGSAATANYPTVSSGTTGHAESIKVTYDPSKVSYGQLLKVFFEVAHDPTELDRQGPDVGTQYRSAIFFANDEQRHIADDYLRQLQKSKVFNKPIVTEVSPLKAFYPAEAYHQDYLELHPDSLYIVINDLPKIENLKRELPHLYMTQPVK
jgi:peptide-methionine (S)-S-oxide reductase